ncbi:hypothetical protein [Celeribacter sp.]|uniref:COG4223 family protein n=1 Tax=Celeribacter sp. TaxID=1890673 RepID=UPI003A927B30
MAQKNKPTEEPQTSQEDDTGPDQEIETAAATDVAEEAEAPLSDAQSDTENPTDGETDTPQDDSADDAVGDEDTATESAPEPVATQSRGVVPMVFAGVVCVALGYAGAQFIKPSGWPFPGSNTDEISARIDALSSTLEESQSRTDQLEADLAAARTSLAAQIESEVSAIDLDAQIAPLSEKLTEFADRLDTMEARPVAEAIVSPEATAAYERQLAEMRELLDSEIARLEAAQAEAAAQESQAKAATALAAVKTAVDSGEPYAALLSEIEIDVPEAVIAAAETGVAGIASLQDRFPDAARTAMSAASRAAYEAGEESWFSTFTRTQLGLRSLSPKEGNSVDAILSRAEADVREADFSGALDTLALLPDAAKAELSNWMSDAAARVAVTKALAEMTGK